MFKKIICLIMGFIFLGTLQTQIFAQESPRTSRVLMLYQERNFFADKRDTVTVIEELLSAYDVSVSDEAISNVSNVNFENYDTVIVIALDQGIESKQLVDKLSRYRGQIIWLGGAVEALLTAGNYPLKFKGQNYQYVYVDYTTDRLSSNQAFLIGEKRVFYEVESLSNANQVFSWLSDGFNKSPFIVQAKNLTYVSRVDMNEPLFFIFAEYLSELFPRKALPNATLMVSIQDVHGFTDFVKLKQLADKLETLAIPFNVQVIPYFKLSGSKKIYNYQEIPQFVETLRYLESKGASLIVESMPVEINENQITPIAYETVLGRAKGGLKSYLNGTFIALASDGLEPVGYSSPHANLSLMDLSEMREHINTFVGIRYITEGQSVIYPYVLENAKGFNRFYPLNLGYLDYSNPAVWSNLEETFNKLSLVEKPFYGIYITPDIELTYLDELSHFTEKRGLSYFDLTEEPIKINFENLNYDTTRSEVYNFEDPSLEKSVLQRYIGIFANGVLVILIMGVSIFTWIYRRSLKRTRDLARKE